MPDIAPVRANGRGASSCISSRGRFPPDKTTEERLYLRLAPDDEGKRDQAHGTNLLDNFVDALIKVRSRDAYFPLIASLRPPTSF